MSPHLKTGASGHLLRNSGGHLVIECASVEPTCDIDCSTMASAYTILGVNGLTGCSACSGNSWPAWNGVVQYTGYGCQWVLYDVAGIAGKQPSFSGATGADCTPGQANGVGIWYNHDLCRWELAITCRDAVEYHVIWAGGQRRRVQRSRCLHPRLWLR
jgi:hypothetical protein